MSVALKISDGLVTEAKIAGATYNRSATKQIEYWAKIGKAAEENPDLPFNFIIGVFHSLSEKANKQIEEIDLNNI